MNLDTKKSIFGSQQSLWFHIWFTVILSYKMPDITTNYKNHFTTKCGKSLLQNTSGFLLQNATIRPISKNGLFRVRGWLKLCAPDHGR